MYSEKKIIEVKEKSIIFFLSHGYSVKSGNYIINSLNQYDELKFSDKVRIVNQGSEWCVFHQDKLVVMVS